MGISSFAILITSVHAVAAHEHKYPGMGVTTQEQNWSSMIYSWNN